MDCDTWFFIFNNMRLGTIKIFYNNIILTASTPLQQPRGSKCRFPRTVPIIMYNVIIYALQIIFTNVKNISITYIDILYYNIASQCICFDYLIDLKLVLAVLLLRCVGREPESGIPTPRFSIGALK